MKRLPPAKRNQLIGVIIATLGLICLVYVVLIRPQDQKNNELGMSIKSETDRLGLYEKAIQQLTATSNALAAVSLQLAHSEGDVASGDLYAWTVDTMRRFKTNYRVEIPSIGEPSQPGNCDLLGGFPYKQIRFTLSGTAYYHDLGKFIADFENNFSHCQVINLSADPANDNGASGEKLNFRMDIVALVKPNN